MIQIEKSYTDVHTTKQIQKRYLFCSLTYFLYFSSLYFLHDKVSSHFQLAKGLLIGDYGYHSEVDGDLSKDRQTHVNTEVTRALGWTSLCEKMQKFNHLHNQGQRQHLLSNCFNTNPSLQHDILSPYQLGQPDSGAKLLIL